MPKFLTKSLVKWSAAVASLTIAATASLSAHAESPFHTGVWQMETAEGTRGLVVSDWLVFENGLPKRWLYRRAGTNDQNQFDFFTRTMGESGYTPVGIRVYRTGPNEMKYTIQPKARIQLKSLHRVCRSRTSRTLACRSKTKVSVSLVVGLEHPAPH